MKKLLVTILFSLIFFFQSLYIIGFSFKEGPSIVTLIAFCFFLVPTIVMWVFFYLVTKEKIKSLVLPIAGILLMICLEVLLPVSPIKTTIISARTQRAIDRAVVSELSDELFYSALGNPIGIRIKYSVEFQDSGEFSVSPTLYSTDSRYHHYQTGMSHFANIEIIPEPERSKYGGYIYRKDQQYQFIADFLPGFIFLARRDSKNLKKNELCLYETESQTLSVEEFGKLVSEPLGSHYNIEVGIGGNSYFVNKRWTITERTTRSYSHKTFYDSALKENAGKCNF